MTLPLLLQAGLPALVKGLADGLKAVNTPVAQGASAALQTLSDAFGKGDVSDAQLAEIHRHLEKMQEIEGEGDRKTIEQVNESLRAEVASNDPYVRRMRPTFGYIIAVTWAAQMFAIAYVIVAETNQAALVIDAVQSLGTIWTVGLSVLGIYVYKRSEEKRIALPPEPPVIKEPKAVRPRAYNP